MILFPSAYAGKIIEDVILDTIKTIITLVRRLFITSNLFPIIYENMIIFTQKRPQNGSNLRITMPNFLKNNSKHVQSITTQFCCVLVWKFTSDQMRLRF